MGRLDPLIRDAMLAHLRQNHPSMCRHWFDDIEPVELAGGTLKMLVREPVQLKYLQRCCVDQFTEAAQVATGRLLAVKFVGEGEPVSNGRAKGERSPDSRRGLASDDMLISPDYSFENFVIGPENRLAHAAAIAVAKNPGRTYNPLFIHGGVGLGKTHLLHAICQASLRTNPSLNIYYVSCNGFMTQFLDAVQEGVMSDFRHRFRNVDLLVVDDIHDLSKRDRTQEEFFHTFNSLYQAGRQIVLSSDAAPSEIPSLEERLVSRFNSGLVALVDKPCYETRVAIVKQKAALRSVLVPEDAASYIAAKVDNNIRELEGAIVKLQSLALVNNCQIDLELAKQAVGDSHSHAGHVPSIQTILEILASFYNVRLSDLLSKRRQKSVSRPRQVGMWLSRKYTRFSLEEIGNYFGGRDHTTVMHAIRAIESRRSDDHVLARELTLIEQRLPDGSAAANAQQPALAGAA